MDGFDVRGMQSGRVYDVDARAGRYQILAGYAISADIWHAGPTHLDSRSFLTMRVPGWNTLFGIRHPAERLPTYSRTTC